MNAEPAKDNPNERLSRIVRETKTEEGIGSTRYDEGSGHQQSSYKPSNSSSIINTTIYPSWSCVLPLFIKGLLFPPLAGFYRRRYYKHGTPADLTKSIRFAFASLATTHPSHPSLPFYKLRLAQDLRSRYRSYLNSIDLTLALLLQRSAINSLPVAHPDRNWHREHLHGSIAVRYERYSNASDLDLLLEIEETALADVPPNSPEARWWKESKAKTHGLRYTRTMNPSDLQLQIDWCIASMDGLDPEEPSFLEKASTLCSVYVNRFKQYRDMDDLIVALFWGHHSLRDSSSIGVTECALRYQALALAYGTRYEFMGLVGDNDRATDLIKQAIQRVPSSHSFSLMLRHNVGVRYLDFGQFTRSLRDLDMAIEWLSTVLEGYPRTNPHGAICAGNLSTAYIARYNLEPSRLEDLESAVELVLRCVQALGDSHPRSAFFQGKLSTALHTRYQRHRNKKDLDAAIHWCTSSIALTQPNTKPWNERQNRLGNLYMSLYRHTKRADHLDEAMTLLMNVVASTPQDDDAAAEFYMDLADAHSAVYDLRGGIEHRDAIMRWNVAAVQAAKPDNRRLQVYKYSLGFEYYNRYYRLRDEEDLNNALKYVSEALALAPSGDSTRASYNRALGDIYRERYNLSRSVNDGDEALLHYRNAAQSQNSNPIHIWHVVNRWARFAETMQKAQDCIDAYRMAFKILPELFWLGSDMKSRHHALIAFGINDASNQAVTGCIRFQRLPLAVEFLEQSLAMTFQQLLGLQRDLGNLEGQFPAYASMLETLSTKIRALTLSANDVSHDKAVGSVESSAQSRLVIERNTLLEKIRELPGFESFLLPTQFEKLRVAAIEGPIILLNTNQRLRHYCDALILLPGGSITHVVLRKVIAEDVVKQAGALKKVLKAYGIQTRGVDSEDDLYRAGRVQTAPKANKDAAFQPLLDWLWSRVVSPVFEALKANGIIHGRIWWCPTGAFTHLPLHAAGPPSDYIQSYTSNLESLIRARSLPSVVDSKITAIGLSTFGTGGFSPLPGVLSEISSIKTAVGKDNVVTLLNDEANLANTIAALSRASWLHLACHGEQGNAQDPLKSRIILFNGENLDLQTIIATSTPSAEFVFLSACETATGDADMSNESLHLAGGMLFAGFKAAIGTLWSINDADGPVVAQSVYSRIFAEGERPTASRTAEALHFAIKDLRMRGAPPHRWAPFIHIGI